MGLSQSSTVVAVIIYYILILRPSICAKAYSNRLFTISRHIKTNPNVDICLTYENDTKLNSLHNKNEMENLKMNFFFKPTSFIGNKFSDIDPFEYHLDILQKFLFGKSDEIMEENKTVEVEVSDTYLLHSPTGHGLRRAELFNNKVGVHLPIRELIHTGYCQLNITEDYMQTAVDALAIFVEGNIEDIRRLPPDYVLRSARTIAMLKISNEKLAATWEVVKESRHPIEVEYETLERYRPLFKYLNGKEMARLNLTNHRILRYIGTHPALNRHQVGVIASKYIKLNKHWSEAKYLNLMNNLICGIPMSFMRKIPENTFLQLSHQIFYHTRACDPLQRRFYLVMMSKTQALGKPYSWNAQDVSRLGLLLAEVGGQDLSTIKPEALAGLTAQVMRAMQPQNLQYLSKAQLQYIQGKKRNILAKKLKKFQDQNSFCNLSQVPSSISMFIFILICLK